MKRALALAIALSACGGTTALPLPRALSIVAPDGTTRLVSGYRVATTAEERARGLRGSTLASGEALVLAFPIEGEVCITNAGVDLAIDVVFASGDGSVVAKESFAAGDAVARCHASTRFAIELPRGAAREIAIEDRVVFAS